MSDRYAKYTKFEFDYPADRVLRITLNNPKTYNSLDAEGHKQFTYIWRDIDDDPDISAVILTGKGKAFSSGGDFSMIEANMNDEKQRIQAWKEERDLVCNIIHCNKPNISAINGVAVGAGRGAAPAGRLPARARGQAGAGRGGAWLPAKSPGGQARKSVGGKRR